MEFAVSLLQTIEIRSIFLYCNLSINSQNNSSSLRIQYSKERKDCRDFVVDYSKLDSEIEVDCTRIVPAARFNV